jgi:hypothetical protein
MLLLTGKIELERYGEENCLQRPGSRRRRRLPNLPLLRRFRFGTAHSGDGRWRRGDGPRCNRQDHRFYGRSEWPQSQGVPEEIFVDCN